MVRISGTTSAAMVRAGGITAEATAGETITVVRGSGPEVTVGWPVGLRAAISRMTTKISAGSSAATAVPPELLRTVVESATAARSAAASATAVNGGRGMH